MTAERDSSIEDVLARLRLSARGWIVVDHWDGDRCAVGVAAENRPRQLVYISTFNRKANRYYFECEAPTGDNPTDFKTTDEGEVDFTALVAVMEKHLGSK